MIQIRTASPSVSFEEPAGLLVRDLLTCHGHIRRFTGVAVRLATAPAAHVREIEEAAAGLVDYFGRALPLHVADEDQSLYPRLLELPREPALADAIERMTAEHGPLEGLLGAALPRWRRVAANARVLPGLRRDLLDLADALEVGFTAHLRSEETIVFPALPRLAPEHIVAIRREMKQRRAPLSGRGTTIALDG